MRIHRFCDQTDIEYNPGFPICRLYWGSQIDDVMRGNNGNLRMSGFIKLLNLKHPPESKKLLNARISSSALFSIYSKYSVSQKTNPKRKTGNKIITLIDPFKRWLEIK